MTYYIKQKGIITPETRALIRTLVQLNVPFENILDVIKRVCSVAGIQVVGKFDRHSVRRVVKEGGIFARLQIAQEVKRVQSLTVSQDGTSHKNAQFEASHLTYKILNSESGSGSNIPCLRALPVTLAPSHTSAQQLRGWNHRLSDICTLYNNSPLGKLDPLTIPEVLRKVKGMLSDHANDQKSLAAQFELWKKDSDRQERGAQVVASMSTEQLAIFGMRLAEQNVADAGGYENWEALSNEVKDKNKREAYHRALVALGNAHFKSLTVEEQRWVDLFFWVGCGMHKDLNAVKWGAKYMEEFWHTEEAMELGAIAPRALHNKDNAATIADEKATTSKARAEKLAARGGVKTTSLAGAIFRNKHDSKGQQDSYRWFFQENLVYSIQFPDTSNTRFGSHCEAASELLVNNRLYIQFLEVVRSSKETGVFNHMEQNVYDALQDPPTLTELAVLSLYSQAISQPYMRSIRGSSDRANALDLGPFHAQVICHCQKLLENPNLLILGTSSSFKEATLDGQMWERAEAVYAVQSMAQHGQLPFLCHALVAFLKGALIGWQRFTAEFEPGGRIAAASSAERAAAYMRPTNDHSESTLGEYRQAKRHAPSMSLALFNDKMLWRANGTEAWVNRNQTPEIDKYVASLARGADSSRKDAKDREQHVSGQKERATRKEKERAQARERKTAREAKVEGITPQLDIAFWTTQPLRKVNDSDIKLMLAWLRSPARKGLVKVPPGLSSLNKERRFNALVAILQDLDQETAAQLLDTRTIYMGVEGGSHVDDTSSDSDESLSSEEEEE
ncbi:hypothetical protein DENSPDRAFT_768715 [Dentipellis sp. KUC8613]|nr:hypothetical protein DENSPDRAFT_768715 [Dentipellis sp. KUC8613]